MIDREQMQRVLSNLLNNAFKFTPDGGEIDLALAVRRLGKERKVAEIKVSDTGKGISEGALKRIFDPFYQDPDRKSQGTGIGLAMSKGIVTLHHGSITASNRKGGGAVFCVTLPLGDVWMKGDPAVTVLSGDAVQASLKLTDVPSEEYLKAAVQKEPFSGGDAQTEKNTMLIVEDDADMRKMLVSIFNNSYGIFEASDGAEGFSLAKSKQPDIIISDVMMPVMDGMSLVAKLRQDFETCHIPVILLTAMSSSDNEIEGINKGADDYIGKPFRVDVLEARCRNLLENRNLLRKKFTKTIASFEGLTKTEKDADFLSRAATVIEENLLSSELGVALLCDKLNISRTILDQKIKGITGMTPRVFIETIRMKQACRLLEAGSGNISEIAYMLGFSSPKYFTIRFKKQFGQTPTEWLASRDGS
jgi:DNA-binding response OmpR family regulator